MVTTAASHTTKAARGRHVLAIQDLTELNFAAHVQSKRGFGTVGNGKDIGLFLHPVIVADAASGGLLGLVEALVLNRTGGPQRHRKTRPIEEKESQRWLEGLRAADRALSPTARLVTVVTDREGDIYAELVEPRSDNVHLLIRSAQDRSLQGGAKLYATGDAMPVAGQRLVNVPARPGGRPARQAKLAIAFGSVDIACPGYLAKAFPASVRLQLVIAREIDPPSGETPICWRLLTTHAVANRVAAEEVIDLYRRRWLIEQVFRTLKTQGLDIEESQVLDPDTMQKLATAALIAAVRIMQLVMARDGNTQQLLADALDPDDGPLLEALVHKLEGKTDRLKNPYPLGSLARLSWVVGRLGGWDGYVGHGYKPAGPKTIANGLKRFDAIRQGWSLR